MAFTTTLSPFTGEQDVALFASSELSVAQAAKILDMSVGCVNEFLNDGIIESRWENGERLVQQDSLLAFDADYREGRAVMAEITRLSQEMGLYDD